MTIRVLVKDPDPIRILIDGEAAFSPEAVPGLVLGWRPDANYTSDSNGITQLAGAFGTTVPLTAAGSTSPDMIPGLAPLDQNIIRFTGSRNEKFSFDSTIISGQCSMFAVCAPAVGGTQTILGRSTAQSAWTIGAPRDSFRIRAAGASLSTVVVNLRGDSAQTLSNNLQILQLDVDFIANTATPYYDGIVGPTVHDEVNLQGNFLFNQVGIGGTTTSAFNGYMGPILVYNRIVDSIERALITAWLEARWRGLKIYLANAGNDASGTYWNKSTPLLSPELFLKSANLHGGEIVAPKGGDIFRPTTRIEPNFGGVSNDRRITLDGGVWGTGKADFRYSTTPTPVLRSGTTYSIGNLVSFKTVLNAVDNGSGRVRLTLNDTIGIPDKIIVNVIGIVGIADVNGETQIDLIDSTHIDLTARTFNGAYVSGGTIDPSPDYPQFELLYYVPGGTIVMTPTTVNGRVVDLATNVQRLKKDTVMLGGVPAIGNWGLDGEEILVNTGTTLTTGEIEKPQIGQGFPFHLVHDNWNWRNMVNQFCRGRGFQNSDARNVTFFGLEAYFCHLDGVDGFQGADNFLVERCQMAWCGPGTVDGGDGDAYSMHDQVRATIRDCSGFYNDKSGNNCHAGTDTLWDNCIFVGNMPFAVTGEERDGGADGLPGGGVMHLRNCIGVLIAGSLLPYGIHNATTDGSTRIIAENVTLISRGGGTGVLQDQYQLVTVMNTIIEGFDVGIDASSPELLEHFNNCLHNNATNYVGTPAGAGEITGNPLFTNMLANDFRIADESPCVDAGVVATAESDFAGSSRIKGPAPDIGAYEQR